MFVDPWSTLKFCKLVVIFFVVHGVKVFLCSVITADAVDQERTAHVHARILTAAARPHDDIHLRPSSPTSKPSPPTTPTATRSWAGVTAGVEAQVTRGSALAHGPALLSKWTETGTERGTGRETETAALTIFPQRNTSTSEEADIGTEGIGRGLGPTRGSAATRVNTTTVVDTQDTVATDAETLSLTSPGADGQVSVCSD